MLLYKVHIVAVLLCFNSSVCVSIFILVEWTSANLPSRQPHLDLGRQCRTEKKAEASEGQVSP